MAGRLTDKIALNLVMRPVGLLGQNQGLTNQLSGEVLRWVCRRGERPRS